MHNPYIQLSDPDLLKQCRFNPHKTTGPGGQRKNKKQTAVRLKHNPTGISVVAGNRRSQGENKSQALKQLRFKLAQAVRFTGTIEDYALPEPVRPYIYKSSAIRINPSNPVYVQVFNTILDLFHLNGGDHKKVAEYLETTASQLLRLVHKDPGLLTAVNKIRKQNSLPDLAGKK